jgi:hypothetical protein
MEGHSLPAKFHITRVTTTDNLFCRVSFVVEFYDYYFQPELFFSRAEFFSLGYYIY